jgi:hypothetical protein
MLAVGVGVVAVPSSVTVYAPIWVVAGCDPT